MDTALLLVALTVTTLVGTALSEKLRLPAPMLLIAIGIVGSYLPMVPDIRLSPEVVLVGLLPPLLYATSLQTSIIDVRANLLAVSLLSIGLVIVTTVAVGAVVVALLPDVGWPVALALGAVVAPPDAVAASAVARRIGLPRQIVTILESEALLNDATALVALRSAIVAIAGAVSIAEIGVDFAIAAGGGALVGFLTALAVIHLRRRTDLDPLIDTGMSFVIPFVAYLIAEELEASGVIAVVVAALLIGHKAPVVQSSASRITETVTWSSIAFVLEHAVFLLIGLQFARVVTGVSGVSAAAAVGFCVGVLLTVVLVRLVWVCLTQWLTDLSRPAERRTPWSHTLVVSWAGMRGVVTMAAVFVIPADVPHHDLLVLAAMTVVLGTLYVQGLTLPLLTRWLSVPSPDPAADALVRATVLEKVTDAGLAALEECSEHGDAAVTDVLRARAEQRTFAAWEALSTTAGQETPSQAYSRIRTVMIEAERAEVLRIRSQGRVPSATVRDVLAMLDREESMLDTVAAPEDALQARGREHGGACAELHAHPATPTPPDVACAGCDADGVTPVALRRCLTCGHVGCCDSSPGRHATAHHAATGHPVMQSAEPGETWRWCYLHRVTA
ncbi:MAG: cation:proton antiporter [Mobilicoccus sp.]|nr:cation:proton antiporter [Mobilicoccus sp.]